MRKHDQDTADLHRAIKSTLLPQTVAALVGAIQATNTGDRQVEEQLDWLNEQLIEIVGGTDAINRLADELGL